jgi:hypothetical protein
MMGEPKPLREFVMHLKGCPGGGDERCTCGAVEALRLAEQKGLGVPDAELFSALMGGWVNDINRALTLLNGGDAVLAAVKLTEIRVEMEEQDQLCADAWDAYDALPTPEEGKEGKGHE